MADWNDFNKYDEIDKYLPRSGEGGTMATQISAAVSKLIYKWFNDGDVYDNTYRLSGWINDLSSYANWLYTYVPEVREILDRIGDCEDGDDYSDLLLDLCAKTSDKEKLDNWNNQTRVGSVYKCDGPFSFLAEENDEDSEQ